MKLPLLTASGIGLCFCLYGCDPDDRGLTENGKAYVPVYMAATEKNNISISSVRSTDRSGKIYAYGNYIFQNDLNKGIHIIDNTDRAHPQKIAFLNIPYNTEFAVKGRYLYANNVNDLVVIDIGNINNPTVVKRMENAFPYVNQEYPTEPGYFVCPDPSKGIVVAWELQTVKSPACRR
ncbi:hypothetical protein FAM09_01625 [Niastella caeni]|uniref:LVIVD repeat-containing protein n=1 Tax=Niastella caeni TaxID=2569763 RepID=A0A4S8HYT3_9BACT|nr:hypothetical protein [Niastella caeni]THU40840.1 hypothetical protein FAM09_01625 [Niastella caeni]